MRGIFTFAAGCLVIVCILVVALGAGAFALGMINDGETLYYDETVALDGATRIDAGIDMGAGDLRIRPASMAPQMSDETALEASFEYDENRTPTVDYVVNDGGVGTLHVSHDEPDGPFGWFDWGFGEADVWDLALTDSVPIDLDVDLGAGDTDLNLQGLQIERLDVDGGAGQTTIDLSGERPVSVEGVIDQGAGDLTIIVPEGVGVHISVDQGAGDISTDPSLNRSGDTITSPDWENQDVIIELTVSQGAGDVSIEVA